MATPQPVKLPETYKSHITITKEEIPNTEIVDDNFRNTGRVWCRLCGCLILDKNTAQLVRRPTCLPTASYRAAQTGAAIPQGPTDLELFWHLSNMYDFMNIGFTKAFDNLSTANGGVSEAVLSKALPPPPSGEGAATATATGNDSRIKRYLTCADCEKEVLGFQYMDEPKNIYLSYDRVAYVKPTN